MSDVKIFWDSEGREVDTIGKKKLLKISDGDTPHVSMSVRMLSIDTPEVHYPSNRKPSGQDANLPQLANWIGSGDAPVNPDLGAYLCPKLASGVAGTLQEKQGKQATIEFQKMLDTKLKKPNGKKRNLFVYAADEHFDYWGRLLAYVAPDYTAKERQTMSRKDRATFNLLMVESGWAASFPIYPSIPRAIDLEMLQEAAKQALDGGKGAWADPLTLTGYEFRMCVKLHGITKKITGGENLSEKKKGGWISRYCVDMVTREVFYPQDYFKVEPYNRIFVWPEDISEAIGMMNLLPADSGQ